MTVQWYCDHSSSDFLPAYCFFAPVLSCLLHSHSSHLPWPEALHGSPGPIEEQCPLKSVTMLFQEVPNGQSKEDTVGRPLPHLAAAMQASGEAVYCDDIPRYENELFLRLVTSTRAHAKIKCVQWKHLGRRAPGASARHWRCHDNEPSPGPPGPERSTVTRIKPRQERSRIQEGLSGAWEGGVMIMET